MLSVRSPSYSDAEMSNGWLAWPPTTKVKPVPVPVYAPKSTWCVDWPDAWSAPRTVVAPEATTVPEESCSCQGSGAVVELTTVARLGPSGR